VALTKASGVWPVDDKGRHWSSIGQRSSNIGMDLPLQRSLEEGQKGVVGPKSSNRTV
jgi:hypothetical protein